jgi:FMN phosphatase YigB (HAD superfamily)
MASYRNDDATPSRARTVVSAEIEALIDQSDVVSFDVFDTLLRRRHYVPADVFAELGSPSRWYRLARILAEMAATMLHRKRPVTLAQIYSFAPGSPERELAAEAASMCPNPSAQRLYEYAASKGKRIVATSDMYLSADAIRLLLKNAGYDRIERVYVSCDAGVTKRSGGMYRHLIEDLQIAPQRLLHIGDDLEADVRQPSRQGIVAFHLPSSRAVFETRNAIHPELARSLRRSRKTALSLILGLMRDALGDVSRSDAYAFGYSTLGPVAVVGVDLTEQITKRDDQINSPSLIRNVSQALYGDTVRGSTSSAIDLITAALRLADPHKSRVMRLFEEPGDNPTLAEIQIGAIDFARQLASLRAAGFSVALGRNDIPLFLRPALERPRREEQSLFERIAKGTTE